MLNSSKLVCFAATTNPEAAKTFYGDKLGLPLVHENPFALVFDANATMLRVQKVSAVHTGQYTSLGWEVEDIRATIRHLAEKGVNMERYAHVPQDELGVWTTPDGTGVAWFLDPDGSILSLTQFP